MGGSSTKPSSRRSLLENSDDMRVVLAQVAARVEAIDNDYTDLRGSVVEMGRRIEQIGEGINAKIDAFTRPNYQVYIAFGSMVLVLFGAFWTAGISPIKDVQVTRGAAIAEIDSRMRAHDKEDSDNRERHKARDQALFVTKNEHNEFRSRLESADSQLRNDLNELKREARSAYEKALEVYPASRAVEELSKRISAIESKISK